MLSDDYKNKILHLLNEFKEQTTTSSSFAVTAKHYDAADLYAIIESAVEGHLTHGTKTVLFEKELQKKFETQVSSLFVNSGSSANLLAISSLFSTELEKIGLTPLKSGDEVITCAASFPTTVNPLLQNNLVPVFCDLNSDHLTTEISHLEKVMSPKTKAVFLTHNLGIPFDAEKISLWCKDRNLYFIEDCCDALGSKIRGQSVGKFGHFSTSSFYPAHHITTGEGGALHTSNPLLRKIAMSYRDWGRDCWCPTGRDNTCQKRFDWDFTAFGLPEGYDHKYIYSHIGYNLKATDMQASLGLSQLNKFDDFLQKRTENWNLLFNGFKNSQKISKIFKPIEAPPDTEPSWFGFPFYVHEGFSRKDFVQKLEQQKISTRMFFAGNLIHQPAYQKQKYRQALDLKHSQKVMNQLIWIGVHPLISQKNIQTMLEKIESICNE